MEQIDIRIQKAVEILRASRSTIAFTGAGISVESGIPLIAKQNGAKVIEVNPNISNYSNGTTDIFLQGKATEIMDLIGQQLFE